MRKRPELTSPCSAGRSVDGSNSSSCSSTRRIGRTTPRSGHAMAVKSEAVARRAEAGVKMELGVSDPSH